MLFVSSFCLKTLKFNKQVKQKKYEKLGKELRIFNFLIVKIKNTKQNNGFQNKMEFLF